jgi:hypothetical protein
MIRLFHTIISNKTTNMGIYSKIKLKFAWLQVIFAVTLKLIRISIN